MLEGARKRIVAAVSMHHSCNDGSAVVLPAVFPLLYDSGELIGNYSDIGDMILAGLVTALVFQALVGHFARTRHSRYYLAFDALMVGAALILMTRATGLWMLVVFFMMMRMGTSIYHPVGISWISSLFHGGDLDRAMGFQSAFGNIGVLVAFAFTGILAESFGWRAPLLIWGGINLAAVLAGLLLTRGTIDAEEAARQKEEEKEPVSWKAAFLGLLPFVPMALLGGLGWGVAINYAPSLLNHRLGVPMSATGLIMSVWMGAGTLAAFFYGRISSLLSRGRTMVYAYAAITAVALIFGLGRNVPLAIAAFALFGVALFVTYPANLSFIGNAVSRRNRTAAFSITSNMMIIGNSVFSFISGRLSDAFGINTPFLMLGCGSLAVLAYLLMMIRTGRIEAEGCLFARTDPPA